MKIWTVAIITSSNVGKKLRFNKVTWIFELLVLSRGKIFTKISHFVDITWKFELPLLSGAEIFSNMADFMKSLENSHCPYDEVKFSRK